MSLLQVEAQSEVNLSNKTAVTADQNSTEFPANYRLSGMYNITTLGILSGSSQNSQKAPFSFLSLMMYQLDDHIAFGAGMGVEFLEETYLPIVADLRYYMRRSSFSPFVFFETGYSLPTQSSASQNMVYPMYSSYYPYPYPQPSEMKPQGGFLMNPGFGVRHMFRSDFGFEISFGYRYQQLNYQSSSNSHLEAYYNRLNIRIGILFQ